MSQPDREAILRRRAAFVAAALVGLATTEARAQDGGAGGEAGGGAGGEAMAGGGEGGAPQPCLSIAKNDCDCSLAAQADGSGAVGALVVLAIAGARRRRSSAEKA